MKYDEAKQGRVFVLRLEDGEILQDEIEKFARSKQIKRAKLQLLGGADKGSELIVGPQQGRAETIQPVSVFLDEMHEVVGNGTLFPDERGEPRLHCHIACGRGRNTLSGEIRNGVIVWHVMEVIITELVDCRSIRRKDPVTGFTLLDPDEIFG